MGKYLHITYVCKYKKERRHIALFLLNVFATAVFLNLSLPTPSSLSQPTESTFSITTLYTHMCTHKKNFTNLTHTIASVYSGIFYFISLKISMNWDACISFMIHY